MILKDINLSNIKFKINLDTKRPHQKIIYEKGDWEPIVTKAILKHLKPGMLFIDVGACIGWYTLMAASIVGDNGHVISFEPDPYYFDTLTKNIELNGFTNTTCSKKAVSDMNGTDFMIVRQLRTWKEERVARLLGHEETTQQGIPVDTTTLDFFLSDIKRHKVDFVKVDAEGAEEKVLRGMMQTIKKNPHIKIVCEVHSSLLPLYGTTKQNLFKYISKNLRLKYTHLGATYWIFHS